MKNIGLTSLFKGGRGSGNFGHTGRPGKVGGSSTGAGAGRGSESDDREYAGGAPFSSGNDAEFAEDLRVATALVQKAQRSEVYVTKQLVQIAQDLHGEMAGLEFRIKTDMNRIAEKFTEKVVESEGKITKEQARKEVNDILRYTMTFDTESYDGKEGNVPKAIKKMKEAGFTPVAGKTKNYWHFGDEYKGINMFFSDTKGQTFEMQFHTPQSFATKQANHDDYNKKRKSKDPKEIEALHQAMVERFKPVPVPPGIDKVTPEDLLKRPKGIHMKASGIIIYYYSLGVSEDRPTGIMRVIRDDSDRHIKSIAYWSWSKSEWIESEALMRFMIGEDTDFWEISKSEADGLIGSLKIFNQSEMKGCIHRKE